MGVDGGVGVGVYDYLIIAKDQKAKEKYYYDILIVIPGIYLLNHVCQSYK